MSIIEFGDTPRQRRIYSRNVMATCPDCDGELAVLKVIGGRGGCEYWAMRCIDCGDVHLDILETQRPAPRDEDPRPLA
jgi:uncharacterized Zn finger protein